jgi:hypothetical protein
VQLRREVRACGPVGHIHLNLDDPHTAAQQINAEPGLNPEAACQRPGGIKRCPRQTPLSVQWLLRIPAGRSADAAPCGAHHNPMPAKFHKRAKHGNGHVRRPAGHRGDERARVRGGSAKVGVEEQQWPGVPEEPGGLGAGFERRALAAVAVMPQHGGAGALGHRASAVGGPVVDDQHEIDAWQPRSGANSITDPARLVERGDNNGDARHRPVTGRVRRRRR